MVSWPPVPAKTALGFEIGLPNASHTVNFTGTVRPLFGKTLLPSALIGCKMTPLGVPALQLP